MEWVKLRMASWKCVAAALLLPVCGLAQVAPRYTLNAVVGNGGHGFAGDNGQARDAQLNFPYGVAVDSSGNLFISDQLNMRVRRVGADGVISTVAGTGTFGRTGDGSSATSATLGNVGGIAVDGSGNIYVSDPTNHVIRRFTVGGTISLYAGTGTTGFEGEGTDYKATAALLNRPVGLALDSSGNLFFADMNNHRVRKVTTAGVISTVAGTGVAGDTGDGGAATKARLDSPSAVAVDAAGNLYIVDRMNSKIRKVAPDGTISTIAGTGSPGFSGDGGPARQAELHFPCCIAVDTAGVLYIADTLNNRLRAITADGRIHTIAGNGRLGDSGDSGPALNARFRFPAGLGLSAQGAIYFVDNQNSRVKRLDRVLTSTDAPGAPVILASGVLTAAAYGGAAAVAPGSWVEIFGTDLAAATREWTPADFSAGKAPTQLEGTRVTAGGEPAFLAMVSPGKLLVQMPSRLAPGEQELTVTTAAGTSEAYKLRVNPTQPGLYAPEGVVAAAARAGEAIVLYGTGFGAVAPAVNAGELAQSETALALPVKFTIGGLPAEVTYAGLAPAAVGLYQFRVVVPNVQPGDSIPVAFTLDGVEGTQALRLAVQP